MLLLVLTLPLLSDTNGQQVRCYSHDHSLRPMPSSAIYIYSGRMADSWKARLILNSLKSVVETSQFFVDALNDEKLAEGRSEEMWKYVMDVELWKIKRYTNINVDKLGGTLPFSILLIYCINNIYRNMYEERKWITHLYFSISSNFCNFQDKSIYEISNSSNSWK